MYLSYLTACILDEFSTLIHNVCIYVSIYKSSRDEFSRFTFQNYFRFLTLSLHRTPDTFFFHSEQIYLNKLGPRLAAWSAIIPCRFTYSPVARVHDSAAKIPRVLDMRTRCYRAGEISVSSGHTCCDQSTIIAIIANHVVAHTLAAWSRPHCSLSLWSHFFSYISLSFYLLSSSFEILLSLSVYSILLPFPLPSTCF